MRPILLLPLFFSFASPHLFAQGLKVPPGFEVVEFADGKLANDIHVMTIDPKGRIVVAGRGYIRILVDDDGDGKADRAINFAAEPKDGAMGLLWEGDTLYATGDGGLRRFTAKKNGDKADGPSELIRAMKTGGEHSSHAIRRGPDGWLYVLSGNTAGIDKSYAELPTSPIKEPTAGCVLRFRPDLKKCEIVAHGFRNPYSMDFNLDGDLFTFDADNERCVTLPWYEPTRFYHVIEGRHYGWLNPQHAAFWRRPPYFCDVAAPIATLGRGSPTGVACYAHNQFPPEYHGGFFLCDWTFGKIYFAKLQRKGASYRADTRVFLESLGDNGFAPTACAVDPNTGDLCVSIGGRGTRGAVYRIRHTERFQAMKGKLAPLKMATRSLDSDLGRIEEKIRSGSAPERLSALQMVHRNSQGFTLESSRIRGYVQANLANSDLRVKQAAADVLQEFLRRAPPRERKYWSEQIEAKHGMVIGLANVLVDPFVSRDRGFRLLQKNGDAAQQIEGIRIIQLAIGDVGPRNSLGTIWEGYAPRFAINDPDAAKKLATSFPTANADVDRELARTLGMYGWSDENVRSQVLAKCSAGSSPIEDIHYLACYARLNGKRADTEAKLVAAALLDLDRKIAARRLNRDSNWPLRVQELYVGLSEKDAGLHKAMVEHPSFGRPDHALFANTAGFPKERAARIFLERWKLDPKYALTGNIVQLFDTLPAEDVLPTLRKHWGDTGQENSLLPLLARQPEANDRRRFLEGLNSVQTSVLFACVQGLEKINAKTDASESFALIRALHRVSDKQISLRKSLTGRLEKTTGQAFGADSKRWIAWLEREHPEFGKRLANPDGVDVAKWNQRLARLDLSEGKAEPGKAVYSKASCVQCHSGSQAMGPDLIGVATRFSRADLFTAILQPSKDVPARYQTTVVETRDGKTYQGIVIYDAVDSLILQTGASTTVRMDGASVVSRHVSAQSLMPAGLLDPLSDKEIVDLHAYLRSLGKAPAN
jgi:putative membrane-bound dehydrogenase-like protein